MAETKHIISILEQDITEIKQHILQSNNLILNENEIKKEKSNALDYHYIKNVLYQPAKSKNAPYILNIGRVLLF